MSVKDIKTNQLLALQEQCLKKNVDFDSIQKLLEAEKVKKLQKRNHYIQQTINSEIEKIVGDEN
jgi:hypothetical protein